MKRDLRQKMIKQQQEAPEAAASKASPTRQNLFPNTELQN